MLDPKGRNQWGDRGGGQLCCLWNGLTNRCDDFPMLFAASAFYIVNCSVSFIRFYLSFFLLSVQHAYNDRPHALQGIPSLELERRGSTWAVLGSTETSPFNLWSEEPQRHNFSNFSHDYFTEENGWLGRDFCSVKQFEWCLNLVLLLAQDSTIPQFLFLIWDSFAINSKML